MSRTSSDLDFRDVFGGPPRRSGAYEGQRSRADSFDSSALLRGRVRGGGERVASRQSLSASPGLVEKPVFGELDRPARRRHLTDDFFDDVYPGSDQSGNSTPRRVDQDVFSPTPDSRVLSPNRHGSSLLPRHSIPVKMVKRVEYPFHGTGLRNSTFKVEEIDALDAPKSPYMPIYSPYVDEVSLQDEPKIPGKNFNNQSPLTRKFSQETDETSSMESQSQKDGISLESYISSNQFHFSVYKWAGKGVSLNLPSNWKEGTDPVSRLGRLADVVIPSVNLPNDDDKSAAATSASNQNENRDRTSLNDVPMESKDAADSVMIKETLPLESNPRHSSRGVINCNKDDIPASITENIKPELRNLSELFNEDSDDQGFEEAPRKSAPAESLNGDKKDQLDTKDIYKTKRRDQDGNKMKQVKKSVILDTKEFPGILEDTLPGKQVKGRVKDFIKIFSQGGSPKRKITSETEDKKPKGKERTESKEEQISTLATKEDEEMDFYTMKEQLKAAVESKETSREDEILHSPAIPDVNATGHGPSTKRDGKPSSEPTKESINISAYSVGKSPYEDFEGCLVEQVDEGANKSLLAESKQDQIKAADVKIREWSKGKEGNIRSLLSTLQYVLWPESGWKPVPLVNIIEGGSVKRAYQKALLCLHPDKLQQRGAAMHQKYIAEKVFDILQEAWDQFNSLSAF